MSRLFAAVAITGLLTSRAVWTQENTEANSHDRNRLLTPVSGQVADLPPPNTGEDETRPLTRFDLKYQYQNQAGSDHDNANIITLRADKPFVLSQDWQLATRSDLTLYALDAVGADNPAGDTHFGLGDMLVQALLVHAPSSSRFGWFAGERLVFPTASEDRMGFGKWRTVSTVGFRNSTPGISEGSWIGFTARYDVSFAGSAERRHVSELQLAPQIYIQLPDTWFLNLYPSATDIRYNFSDKLTPYDTGRWFVPIALAGGKMLNRATVASLEVGIPIVDDYMFYEFKIEARIGFFF